MIKRAGVALLCAIVLLGGFISLQAANASGIITQLQKTQQLCLKDVRPIQMTSSYLAPFEAAMNNLCVQKPAVTQQGTNEIIITGQATESGLQQSVPIRVVAQLQ